MIRHAILAAAFGVLTAGSACGQAEVPNISECHSDANGGTCCPPKCELPSYEIGKTMANEWIVGPPGTITLNGTDIRIVYLPETRDFQLFDGDVLVEGPKISLGYLKILGEDRAADRREVGLLPK